eukprot:scaffold1087_cov136-Cylindrotheca_fusiformis.AAC.15
MDDRFGHSIDLVCLSVDIGWLDTVGTSNCDEEPVDPMPAIRKDCIKTCPKPLERYEACKERIKDKPGVTCEIWYYELHHCVDKCVAPKIFAATKE